MEGGLIITRGEVVFVFSVAPSPPWIHRNEGCQEEAESICARAHSRKESKRACFPGGELHKRRKIEQFEVKSLMETELLFRARANSITSVTLMVIVSFDDVDPSLAIIVISYDVVVS